MHTHATTTTRQIQEAYEQANQSHPKTLDTNPSQKQIPTAIGEKQRNKQKTKKQENQASNPLQILFNKNTQTKAPLPFVSLKTPHIHTTVEHV
jgi:hypothetical protein